MNASMTSEYAFKVVPIITKDQSTVIEFLLQYFIRDEPLNASVKLIKEKDVAKNFKNYIIGLFENGE